MSCIYYHSCHNRVLNVVAPPQCDPNMEPVDLPVLSGPNTRIGRITRRPGKEYKSNL